MLLNRQSLVFDSCAVLVFITVAWRHEVLKHLLELFLRPENTLTKHDGILRFFRLEIAVTQYPYALRGI